ncbi:MAG: phosphoribosylglycinamide synthetase C domain-containing protein, partial [Jiangellaceae bacterium]
LLHAAATGDLSLHPEPRWRDGAAVTVVVAGHGYPEAPRTGDPVTGLAEAAEVPGVEILHAGTRLDSAGRVVSSGGRVLSVTAVGADLDEARSRAYEAVDRIKLEGSHHRSDIALAAARGAVEIPSTAGA